MNSNQNLNQNKPNSAPLMEASLSMIIMSIASTAAMSLGLTPDPDGNLAVDKNMARFNIDLLNVLKNKTQNNLTPDEKGLIDHILQDLQNKYLQAN